MPMPQNTCVQNLTVAGPFNQTLFLGSSIISYSCSLGWNQTASEVTVQLVTDPCGGTKEFWDGRLNKQTWTGADPGFLGLTYEITGCPVYFRVGNFEFSGIIQSWTEEHSTSGNPTYSVTLIDPRQLLENSKLIIGDYAGGVGNIANIFNVYGQMESLGSACPQMYLTQPMPAGTYTGGDSGPDGATFGSPARAFGGAKTNPNGMPWYKILAGINILMNQVPKVTNAYSPFGRLVFKGVNYGGFGLIGQDFSYVENDIAFNGTVGLKYGSTYYLDLSELPVPPTYWRISGGSISIMDAINQLCQDAGYDYYIELITTRNAGVLAQSNGVAKFIKIRTVSRLTQPDLGVISSFIGDGSGTINSKRGVELRLETNSAICIGGAKQTLYQIYNQNNSTNDNEANPAAQNCMVLPYFGIYPWDNNVIIPSKEEVNRLNQAGELEKVYEWYFEAETTELDLHLSQLSDPNFGFNNRLGNGRLSVKLTELELVAALAGYDAWLSMIDIENTETWQFIEPAYTAAGGTSLRGIWNTATNVIAAAAMANPAEDFIGDGRHLLQNPNENQHLLTEIRSSRLWDEIHSVYDWVRVFADNLGKKFQVLVPYTCAKLDDDSGQVITSEEPTDGGWTEQSNVLGLSGQYAQFMKTSDNRYGAMIVFSDDISQKIDNSAPVVPKDISAISESDYVILGPSTGGGKIYIKAQVESDYVFANFINRTGPRAVLSISAPVIVQIDDISNSTALLWEATNRNLVKLGLGAATNEAVLNKFYDMMQEGGAAAKYLRPFPYTFDTNPYGAACGIKSNVMVYGPWFRPGPIGGVKVETDEGLTPWEYNGYSLMNLAGQSKADEGVTRMQMGETGDITVPGYPSLPLGAELGAIAGGVFGAGTNLIENRNTSLGNYNDDIGTAFNSSYGYFNYSGKWTGLYGPNVTNINVSVGVQGVQTTYSMRTYTPKFGRFAKANADRLKLLAQNQIKIQKRNLQLTFLKLIKDINSKIDIRATLADIDTPGVPGRVHSAHSLFVGKIRKNDPLNITDSYSIPMMEFLNERSGYFDKGITSLDGFVRPISLSGDGDLPQMSKAILKEQPNTFNPQPPMYKGNCYADLEYDLPVWNEHVQPWQNPAAMGGQAITRSSSQTGNAHDIMVLGRGIKPPSGDYGMCILYPDGGPSGAYDKDYRGLALKGPIFLHSWGYDIDGRPVPNVADTGADQGIFENDGEKIQEKFSNDFLRRPQSWPVAPIDLRFDRKRGVWTCPPAYTLLIVELEEDLCPLSEACAIVTQASRGDTICDKDGQNLTWGTNDTKIVVHEVVGNYYPSGEQLVVYYNTRLYDDSEPGTFNEDNFGIYHPLDGRPETPLEVINFDGCTTGVQVPFEGYSSFNKIKLGCGINGELFDDYDYPSDCDRPSGLLLKAAIEFINTTGDVCVPESEYVVDETYDPNNFNTTGVLGCRIKLGPGLKATALDDIECLVEISQDLSFNNDNNTAPCSGFSGWSNTDNDGKRKTPKIISAGPGVRFSQGEDICKLIIQSNILAENSNSYACTGLVPLSSTVGISKLIAGNGVVLGSATGSDSGCAAVISASFAVENVADDCTLEALTSTATVSKLQAGQNVQFASGGDCAAVISSYVEISNKEYSCEDELTEATGSFTKLAAGPGISFVQATDPCELILKSNVEIGNNDSVGCTGLSWVAGSANKLSGGLGIRFVSGENCEAILTSYLQVTGQIYGCNDISSTTPLGESSSANITKLAAGRGTEFSQPNDDSCKLIISNYLGFDGGGTPTCLYTLPTPQEKISRIGPGRGIVFSSGSSPCEGNISSYLEISNDYPCFAISADENEFDTPDEWLSTPKITRIKTGPGLRLLHHENDDPCTATIGTDLYVQGGGSNDFESNSSNDKFKETLLFSNCFKVSGDACTMYIGLNNTGGSVQTIEVVTDVQLTSPPTGLTITKRTLSINSCGFVTLS